MQQLAGMGVAFVLGGYLGTHHTKDPQVTEHPVFFFCLLGIILAGIVASWGFIRRRKDVTIIDTTGKSLVGYYLFKLLAGGLIGPFLIPYVIYQNSKAIRNALKAEHYLHSLA